jgi:hypothetical protein
MASQNFVIGVKTSIQFGILPEEILALDIPYAPPDLIITTSAAAAIGASSLAVTALTGPIAIGTPIRFGVGTKITLSAAANPGASSLTVTALSAAIPAGSVIYFGFGKRAILVTANAASGATSIQVKPLTKALANASEGYFYANALVTVTTSTHAKTGDISLSIQSLTAAIPNGAIGLHQGLITLQGGTTSSQQIQASDTETTVYGDELTYSTGVVTKASWQVSYSYNVLPTDFGYRRVTYAAQNAIGGVRGWVRKEDPTPAGAAAGEIIQGVCDVTDYQKTNPADGIITGQLTFKGRGTPGIIDAA